MLEYRCCRFSRGLRRDAAEGYRTLREVVHDAMVASRVFSRNFLHCTQATVAADDPEFLRPALLSRIRMRPCTQTQYICKFVMQPILRETLGHPPEDSGRNPTRRTWGMSSCAQNPINVQICKPSGMPNDDASCGRRQKRSGRMAHKSRHRSVEAIRT